MGSVTPSFKKPPVVEVAVSVSFPPIEGFSAVHFGLFWQNIRERFPCFQAKPELPDHIEPVGALANIRLTPQIVELPDLRGWYISDDDTQVIQIQHNRFIYNWRKGSGNAEYPRYDNSVRSRFLAEWQGFQKFLQSERLPVPGVHQCELTYVNHIPFGSGWTSADDLNKVFVIVGELRANSFLQSIESARANLSFLLPNNLGRLRAAISPVQLEDESPILGFTLSARGAPCGTAEPEIIQWMDLARTWIVNAFADLTTVSMHKLWERIE